jgi:hypothetical protein
MFARVGIEGEIEGVALREVLNLAGGGEHVTMTGDGTRAVAE